MMGSRGVRGTVAIPGSGLSYSTTLFRSDTNDVAPTPSHWMPDHPAGSRSGVSPSPELAPTPGWPHTYVPDPAMREIASASVETLTSAGLSDLRKMISCLRMKLSQFEETVRHGRGAHSSPAEPGEHGGQIVAAVEAVLEFGQIARDVLVADRPIGADDRRLDVAGSGVDPLEGRREDGFAARAGADRLVGAAGSGDAAEAR